MKKKEIKRLKKETKLLKRELYIEKLITRITTMIVSCNPGEEETNTWSKKMILERVGYGQLVLYARKITDLRLQINIKSHDTIIFRIYRVQEDVDDIIISINIIYHEKLILFKEFEHLLYKYVNEFEDLIDKESESN